MEQDAQHGVFQFQFSSGSRNGSSKLDIAIYLCYASPCVCLNGELYVF